MLACAVVFRYGLYALLLTAASAQSTPPASQSTPQPSSTKRSAPPPKLTPEQKHGLKILANARVEAAGLSPEMRVFVLWQVSMLTIVTGDECCRGARA
jgi:hypothetical protein